MGSFPETYNHLRGRKCMKFCILSTYITACNRDVFVFKSNLLYTHRANHGLSEKNHYLIFFHQHTIIFLISELHKTLMSGSVRLDTIPDNSILIKVATPSISTDWFFKGYNNTLDAFSTPHWTKDAVPKPVETKTILYEHTNSY